VVHSSDDFAQEHHFLNVVHAFPGGLSAGTVRRPEKDSGDHLQDEREDQRAAPDVSPAGSTGHFFVKCLVNQVVASGSAVEPCE
jgi:hypothetical protein